MKNLIGTFFLLLGLTSLAFAQAGEGVTPISGTLKCGAPEQQHTTPIGGHQDHSVQIEQYTCSWAVPMTISNEKTTDGTSVEAAEMKGNTVHASGLHITIMSNKDTISTSYKGQIMMQGSNPASSKGTWEFTGGTGKFVNIKGGGKFDGTPTKDGGMTFKVDGKYKLPEH